ncbi:MAG: hypothetical protein H6Q77_1003 [Gemmatimonadetes bacterium]|nr:hypothetical protein [Gemmatimonadota bacterium]
MGEMMNRGFARVSCCLLILGSSLSCRPEPAPELPVIDYTLGDYFFQGPDTVPAGRVTFRLELASEAPHVLDLVRLEQGKRIGDLMAAGEDAYDSSWVKSVGGGVTSKAGTRPEYTLRLVPGVYVMLCYFSAPDHEPHFAKGMVKELIVRGTAPSTALPQPDLEVRLVSFGFEVSAPLAAGLRTIRVTNPSDQPHEMIISRLKDGFTLEQARARADSAEPKGPSPWENYGGVADLAPGDTTVMTATFTPGTYRMFCFFRAKDEKMNHAERGMMQVFRID